MLSLDEVMEKLDKSVLVNLATIEDNQPRVRCVTLVPYNDKLWLLTYHSRSKKSQLALNKNIEFNFLFAKDKYQGQIRGRGFATEVNDLNTKELLAAEITWFKDNWSSAGDPDFCLYSISLKEVIVQYKREFMTYEIVI